MKPTVFIQANARQMLGAKISALSYKKASARRDSFNVRLIDAAEDPRLVATGIAGLFMETHPDPANAKSDGPNAWPLDRMESLLTTLVELDRLVKQRGFEEASL